MSVDLVETLLSCSVCSHPVRRIEHGWTCTNCSHCGVVDELGIVHLAPWTTPQRARNAGDRQESDPFSSRLESQLRHNLDEIRRDSPEEYWNYVSHFRPNPYGHAILGVTYAGTVSLVLGSGWGSLGRVISQSGGHAVCVDAEYDGLFYSSLIGDSANASYLRSEPRLPLPFRDAVFDTVFLDYSAWYADGDRTGAASVRKVQKRLVRECHRVLKAGGSLVFTAPNRSSLWSLRQRNTPAHALTLPGYTRMLRRAGFDHLDFHIPWPKPYGWNRLAPSSEASDVITFDSPPKSRKQRLGRSLFSLISRLGIAKHLVPGFVIVAGKARSGSDAKPTSPSTLQLIGESIGVQQDAIGSVQSLPRSGSLSLSAGGSFVKIPLTEHAAHLLRNEAEMLSRLPEDDGFTLRSVELRTVRGSSFAVYPFVRHPSANNEWEDKVERLEYALQRLSADSEVNLLRETDCWKRLTSDETRLDFDVLGAGDVLEVLEQRFAAARVPAGLVHGDLAWGNLIREEETGRIVLIDWDRSEQMSPKLIDTIHACHALARTHNFLTGSGKSYAANGILIAWEMLLAREPGIPLFHYADATLGDLDWRDALGIAITNEIDHHLRTSRANLVARTAAGDMLQARIAFARRCLHLAAKDLHR